MVRMDEEYFGKIMTALILIVLVVLSFLLIKPILLSIILGILLSFIFTPVYKWLYKHTDSKNLSASLIIFLLILIIVIPLWFLTPILIDQAFKIFQATLQLDFISPLKSIFPKFFASEQFSSEIGSILSSFTTRVANSIVTSLSNLILDFPRIALHFLVVLFTFFFVLRDSDKVIAYLKSLLPFPREVETKLFQYTGEITKSVLYGQIIIGIIQGIIAGFGFFIFGVPNALFLALLAILAGVFPIIGTPIIWIPVVIYMFMAGNDVAGWGVLVFGILSSTIDNILRPIFVAKMTRLHSSVVLISMIGGLFFFGLLGLILGPLIIAYLLIILELYRKKPIAGIIIHKNGKTATK
jgi:predicted PurR-regulated permease PerM